MKCDVFISYKHSGKYGNFTEDYQIAQRPYDFLLKMGYLVFFSYITLKEHGSFQYAERRDDVNLYVLIQNVKLNDLPRKLRNSQCFSYKGDLSTICNFINNKLRGNKENQLDLYPNVNTKRVNKKEDASEEKSKTPHMGSHISYARMIPKQALQYNLVLRYEMGQGVEKDEKIAFELYEKAANNGLEIAQEALNRVKSESGE